MEQPAQQPAVAPATNSRYTTERAAGREHIPIHPKGFITIRILQLIFCLICIGLCGYILSIASYPAAGFMVFVSVVTLIISIYNIVALTSSPAAYNYWAVLAFEIFLWIFWLCAFAYMAATCVVVIAYGAYYYDYDSTFSNSYASAYYQAYKTLGSIMGAAAGIGALTWILYFISLVMTAVFISRHRSAGLRNSPGAAAAAAGVAAAPHTQHAQQPAAGEKVEMQPQQPGMVYQQNSGYSQQAPAYGMPQQYPQQPQQQYPQQGYPQQQYPQQSMSPPPQQMSPPPQQYPQQQYAQHSGSQPQQQFAQSVSAPSVDGSAQHTGGVPAQNTGGSYVQGNPVAFNGSHEGQPVHEAHGQSYNPHAPKELQ